MKLRCPISNVPNALAQISSVFHDLKYNILLSRLSRSVGAAPAPRKSIFVAICEPAQPPKNNPEEYATAISAKIKAKLELRHANYQLDLEKVSLGVKAETVAYPYRHGLSAFIQEIQAQSELRHYLTEYKGVRGRAIFVSYRQVVNKTSGGIALKAAVFDRVTKSGCIVYDGFSKPAPLQNGEAADVRARMWMASAAIFIVCHDKPSGKSKTTPAPPSGLSEAQLVEWGYIYGQGKPWVIIVHTSGAGSVKNFMISDRSFITYTDLETPQAIEQVGNEITSIIEMWFPRMTHFTDN